MYKVAFLISHPIQYFSPFFREAAACPDIDLTVYYCSREGHEVFHDKGFARPVKWDTPLIEGYRSIFLRNYNPFGGINRGFIGLINIGLVRELAKGQYDLLFVHGWSSFSSWLAFLTAAFLGTPFVVRGESPLDQELIKRRWKISLKRATLGLVFKKMHAAMAIGTKNAGFYRYYDVPENKIRLMPYAVNNSFFMKMASCLKGRKNELRRKYGLPENKAIVNFTGKLSEKKRPLDLLRAYAAVKAPDKALIFVGDGSLSGDLRSFAEREKIMDVYFMDFINQSAISELYALSDIFVLPSGVGETWGLVVNEAMCFGLPVIISDMVGCGSDLVKHGESGYIFRHGDIVQLTKNLETLIGDPCLRTKMGGRSIEIIAGWSYKEDLKAILTTQECKTAKKI